MKIEIRDIAELRELVSNIQLHVHMHADAPPRSMPGLPFDWWECHPLNGIVAEEIHAITKLLSRSRLKLESALAAAGAPVVHTAPTIQEVILAKNPLDVAIAELTAEVAASITAEESAVTLVNGIPALIDAAVEKALAAGATAAQLGALTGLSEQLKGEASKLAAAVTANTPPVVPVVPVVPPVDPNNV